MTCSILIYIILYYVYVYILYHYRAIAKCIYKIFFHFSIDAESFLYFTLSLSLSQIFSSFYIILIHL